MHALKDQLAQALTELGLTEKETLIYITLLGDKVATANELAKSTGINRSSMYVILEGLRKKGIIGLSTDKKIQGYLAASLETILETLDNQITKQSFLKERLKKIIPELKALNKNTKKSPTIRIFEGETGLKEMLFDVFNTDIEDLRVYENPKDFLIHFPEYIKKDHLIRVKKKIKMYNISPFNESSLKIVDMYKGFKSHDEFSLIPKHLFKYPIDVAIYGNKVTFSSAPSEKNKFGIIIEHKEITESLKSIFDLAWEEAKRIRLNKDLVHKNKKIKK